MSDKTLTRWKRVLQAKAASLYSQPTIGASASNVPGAPPATLILPPTRPGSLGDEAMIAVCFEELERQGHRVGVLDFAEGDRWPEEPALTEHYPLEDFFGAGYLRSLPRVSRVLRRHQRLWCLGADVIDGHYSEVGSLRRLTLTRMASDLGLETAILGFSFNESPAAAVVQALRELPPAVRLCARDPVSHARLLTCLGRPVECVSDLAFGLSPASDLNAEEQTVRDWVRHRRSSGGVVVAVNVSHQPFRSSTSVASGEVVRAYAAAIRTLLRQNENLSVLWIPHDYRDIDDCPSDRALIDQVHAAVDDKTRTHNPSMRLRARFVRALVGEVSFVLSGRMHLVIAALGAGTPASGISYQGKLQGLLERLGAPELAIEPEEALRTEVLAQRVGALLVQRNTLTTRIDASLPELRASSRANFDGRRLTKHAPRLLVVTPEATHPTDKGNRARIVELCRQAQDLGWEVHVAHAERVSGDRRAMHARWGDGYHPIPYRYPRRLAARVMGRLRGAVTGRYELLIDDWYDDTVTHHLLALHDWWSFDAVMVEYAYFSKAFEAFSEDTLRILDTHDSLALRFAKQQAFGQARAGFSTTEEEESKAFGRADVVLAIQGQERDEFRSRTQTKVVTVGHSVPVVAPPAAKRFESRVLFLGSRNQANVDGLRFFLSEVWPRLAGNPAARLLVAGGICDVVDVPPGVETMTVVADVADVYAQSDVVVVPIRFGTGLKIKTIEAMGRGLPTVSTSVGAEGLEEAAGSLVVVDTAEEFAAAVGRLLADEAERRRLSEASLAFVRRWNSQMQSSFAGVLQRPSSSKP